MLTILSLLACKPSPSPTDTDGPVQPNADVSERLQPGQVRAGVIEDEDALFGGISAEGQVGDFKIYNDRAQFIIQGTRLGSYYLELGGGVIDADIVRPEGEIGRDLVEEWNVMFGLGRVIEPESVEVIADGTDGEAVIRVTGRDAPLSLLAGALESPGLVQPQGLQAVTEYRLLPDSVLLEVTTTVTATEADVIGFSMTDLLLGAPEIATKYTDGAALAGAIGPREVTGYLGDRNDGAIAIVAPLGEAFQSSSTADLISELVDLVLAANGAPQTLASGESVTWTRYWAVGNDLAEITDARLAGVQTKERRGTVTAPDGPVAGARVFVQGDGVPYTVAFTDENGEYSALVPQGTRTSVVVDGAGRGMFFDVADGAASWPAFSAPWITDEAAASFTGSNIVRPYAQGRGMSDTETLGEPGTVRVSVDDGLPYTVRIGPGAAFPFNQFTMGRPSDLAAAGWSRGGDVDLLVEPGTYDVIVHRGPRFELHQQSITVTAGEVTTVDAVLPSAFDHTGYVWGDPHAHASPSGDGDVSMEERVMVHAGGGVQLHFGSDHDRVADYRPLVDALGLSDVMQSIVADEVSPPLRGHMNAYPLEPDRTMINNGAVSWWMDIPETTQQLVDRIRERHGSDVIVQSNHPLDTGVAEYAGWSPGTIDNLDYWVNDLNAMEVLNDGDHDHYFPVWLDLTARGYLITPVGVSDAHGHFSGPAGLNGTWIGTDSPAGSVSYDDLREAYRIGDIQAGLGAFLDVSERPGSTFTQATTIDVTALSPSWATIHRIMLYENGSLIETVAGDTASFTLDPPADTVYVIAAEGDDSMQPISGRRPWATTNVYLFDRGADGWSAPLPPLTD